MDEPRWIESRKYRAEDIAVVFDVSAHLVTDDLSPGYWERELARRISRRGLRRRLRTRLRILTAQLRASRGDRG